MTQGRQRTTVRRSIGGAAVGRRRRRTARIAAAVIALSLLSAFACGASVGAVVEHLRSR